MQDMELLPVPLGDPRVEPLLSGLYEEYRTRYGSNDEMLQTEEAEFDPPAGLFLVMVEDRVTVAGGGYRSHGAGVCEVKRMWTHPAHRRRGLAAAVLDGLERGAADAGYQRLILETGPLQPEAAAMYAKRGYQRIPTFGRYREALAFGYDLSPPSGER